MIRRLLSIVFLAAALVSCGPSRHAIHVEMRHPSKSGIELTGKVASILYYADEDMSENEVYESMAAGFSDALEADYGTGEGSVGVYAVERSAGDYSTKDSLINCVIATGGDVVFLLDATLAENRTPEGVPVKVTLYCYDGMDKNDSVRRFIGNTVIPSSSLDNVASDASVIGKQIAESFKAQWKNEQYSIAYYDSIRWYEALERAERFDWKGAMDIWFEFLDARDVLKRSSAEYNIAVACYMLGDYDLAQMWLDRSDSENKMPTLSDPLRKRIEARKQ